MCRVLSLSALVVTAALPLSSQAEPLSIGKPAPTFALRDREGVLVSLADLAYAGPEKQGRPRAVVALDFFRTDCIPCLKALPKLMELHKKFSGKALKVVLVALLEDEEGEDKLEKFLKENQLPFLVLIDPYGAAAKKYIAGKGGFQIPALFVIDKGGVLRHRLQGGDAAALTKMHRHIEELLK